MECEHDGCVCETQTVKRGNRVYCSEWCANAPIGDDAQCRCGHPECVQAAAS